MVLFTHTVVDGLDKLLLPASLLYSGKEENVTSDAGGMRHDGVFVTKSKFAMTHTRLTFLF